MKVLVIALALALPFTITACGAGEETADQGPTGEETEETEVATEPADGDEAADTDDTADGDEAADTDDTANGDEASDSTAATNGEVEGLDGELEGLESFAARSGLPDEVPLPAGTLESSEAHADEDSTQYTLTILNPSSVDSETAMDWYMSRLEAAGFTITSWKLDEGALWHRDWGVSSDNYDAEIKAENEAGMKVRLYIGPEDDGLGFGMQFEVPS